MPANAAPPSTSVPVQHVETTTRVEEALLAILNADPGDTDTVKRAVELVSRTDEPDEPRVLHAAVLRTFFLSRVAAERLGPDGLILGRIDVIGEVNLGFARIPFPLVFHGCRLDGLLNLMHSSIPHIRFCGGTSRGVNANGAHIKGDMVLESVRVMGPVKLRNAEIGGDLRITDTRILYPSGVAIAAQGLQAWGSVRLTGPQLEVSGCITLASADIRADLVCTDGSLSRPATPDPDLKSYERDCALRADGMFVHGLLLMKGVRVNGETRMLGARVLGAAEFKGTFRSPEGGDALSLDGIKVGGGVHLTEGFHAYGATRLIGAEIRKDLDCTGALFIKPIDPENPDPTNRRREDVLRRIALSAGRITVRGSVFFDETRAVGGIRLVGARIRGELRANRAVFTMGRDDYPELEKRDFGMSVFNARDARIDAGCDLSNCITNGMLVFQRSHVGADLSVRNLKIRGSRVNGLVLKGADVRGKFSWELTTRNDGTKLVLSHARVGRLVHGADSWPRKGRLFLRGFTYDSISICPRPDDESPRPQGSAPSHIAERTPWGWRWGSGQTAGKDTGDPPRTFTGWVSLQPRESFDPHPYEQLGRVLRRNGDNDAFRDVGIAREQDWLGRAERTWREKLLGAVLGTALRHGYDSRPLCKATVVILTTGVVLFGLGSGLAGARSLMAPSDAEVFLDSAYVASGQVPSDYPDFNALAYSVDTFLPPVIDFHQESRWLPNPHRGARLIETRVGDLTVGGLLRAYLWFHITAGWVATSLLVVYLTRLIRDH